MKRIISSILLLFMIILVGRGQSSQNFRILADVFDSGGLGLSSPRSANFFNSTILGQSAGLLSSVSQNFKASSGAAGPFFGEIGPTAVEDVRALPTVYALEQNYPNPFNPTTRIQYSVPSTQYVSLKVYDLLGREVAEPVNELKPPGTYAVIWDAQGRASGVYFYRIVAGTFVETKEMILLR